MRSTIEAKSSEGARRLRSGMGTHFYGSRSASSSVALAINNRGQLVVSSSHFYLWEAGIFTDLGRARPLDINERGGQILVEFYDGPAGAFRYFIWERGTVTWLPTLGGGKPSARHINDRGQVVGTDRTDAAGVWHVVVWTRGAVSGRGDQ